MREIAAIHLGCIRVAADAEAYMASMKPWIGPSVIVRTAAAALNGLGAGTVAIKHAISSMDGATAGGQSLPAILLMWAAGIVTTGFGVGGVTFYGLGLAELWWRDVQRRRKGMHLR